MKLMKTLSKTLILAIILSATMFGCSKKSDNGTKPVTATTWTISGTTYKGTFTGFTSNELLAVDNNATNDQADGDSKLQRGKHLTHRNAACLPAHFTF